MKASISVPDRQRGSVTVVMAAVIAVVLLLGLALAGLARATHAQARAQAGADLAALAAARAAASPGKGAPCGVAAQVASKHDVVLGDCRTEPAGMVQVEVQVAISPWPGWPARAVARARAGPVGHG